MSSRVAVSWYENKAEQKRIRANAIAAKILMPFLSSNFNKKQSVGETGCQRRSSLEGMFINPCHNIEPTLLTRFGADAPKFANALGREADL